MPSFTKKDVILAIMSEESSVYVHFDPRNLSVVVPTYLEKQNQVVLQVGWNMPVPIYQLDFTEEAMTGVFSFKGVQHPVRVPYERMFAIVGADSSRGHVFSEDMPEDLKKVLLETRNPPKPELSNPLSTTPVTSGNVVSLDAWKQRKLKNAKQR